MAFSTGHRALFVVQVLCFGLTCVAMSQSVGSPTDVVVHSSSQTEADGCGPSGCDYDEEQLIPDVDDIDHSQLASDGLTSRGFREMQLKAKLDHFRRLRKKRRNSKRSRLFSDYNDEEDEVADYDDSENRTFREEQLKAKRASIRRRLEKLKKQRRNNKLWYYHSRLPHFEDLTLNSGPLDLHFSPSDVMSMSHHSRVDRTPCIELDLLLDPDINQLELWYLAEIMNDHMLPICQLRYR